MNWQSIKTAPKTGEAILCLWPSYDRKVSFHEGLCVWKREYYPLGNTIWEGWWIVGGGLPSKAPEHWRHVADTNGVLQMNGE